MIENHIKAATCQISCGDKLGTGFLVTDKLILTARHCVLEAIENNTVIELTFPDVDTTLSATIVDHDGALDICLLSVPNPLEIKPVELNPSLPREGSDWYSFGYPKSKSIGHRVSGTISQLLERLRLKIDIDLSIEPSTALESYKGLSGSAMISNGVVYGLIKLKLEGSLGSISIHQITNFLTANNISINQDNVEITEETDNLLAEREEFQLEFETLLKSNSGKYIFLEGAHGIGKTTFCNEFNPQDSSLLVLSSYSFSSQSRGLGAAHQIQADVFFDWLSTSISVLLSGKSSRKEEKPYSALITETEHFLRAFSDYCTEKKSQGIIFIDGLNEAMTVGKELFNKLIGLLPLELPSGITIVFTAPNQKNIASSLEGRINNSITLPSLNDDIVKAYCWQEIREDRATSALISHICQKAQGHPLYLRYLIEYVNNELSDNELDDFPVFTGSIRTYYEQLWTKLLDDEEAINLLAIISRLRWGVPTGYLPKILTSTEQNVFIPTFSRIRHLLLNPDETSIYHASFTDFLISKTFQLDTAIQKRLATFCTTETKLNYCTLNSIYHLLRSDEADATQGVISCTQNWIDQCVTLGVEPDTLLFDIEEILGFAVHQCSTNEIVRILLLSQRINFRYNTLFTQSAQLAAKALIALKRPKDALQHAIRFKTLFIHPDDVLQISYSLIQEGNTKEALELLILLEDKIIEAQSVKNLTIGDFILYRQIQIRCLFFMGLADDKSRSEHILNTVINTIQVLRDSTESSPEELMQVAEDIQCVPPSLQLYFYDRYTNLAKMRERFSELPPNVFDLLLGALHQYLRLQGEFRLVKKTTALDEIFADIEGLLSSGDSIDPNKVYSTINILIQLNAPTSLIENLASKGNGILPTKLSITADNNVDIDYEKIYQKGNKWKVAVFLDADIDFPVIGEWSEKEWLQLLEQVFQAIFVCEGKASRGKVDNNTALQEQVLDYLQSTILTSLQFTLAQRVEWEDSYAIPEKTLPLIYGQLAELYRDYYPQELLSFLQHISNQIESQCGVYSEGFREILSVVLHQIIDTDREVPNAVSDEAFKLLQQWKDYILRNVENRHELVPEILQLIPLFVRVDAEEIAKQLYQKMLDVSMGPSWYKEAQLRILVSSLKSIPKSSNVNHLLPQIAGYLERSSGEITFQRYVRHEKMLLIGELFKRGKSYQACQYFKRLVCGTLSELYSEACDGDMDRISTMKGMRYPGGALDEQEAILQVVRNVEHVDWRLSWVLLEIYQYGDTRHLSSYAKQYATLVNSIDIESPEISVAIDRMEFVIGSELAENQHIEFLEKFKNKLNQTHLPLFKDILKPLPEQNTASEKLIRPKGENNADDRDDDALYMPGTFGKHSSSKEADEVLAKAEKKLARGNIEAAKQLSIEVLQILQQGGWSIWGNLSYTARRAEDILLEGVNTADEVIQLYAPLLRNERYDARWILADHLIGRVAKILDDKESNLLVQSAIDHIELIVGDATDQIKAFGFLGKEQESNPSLDLLDLVFWLIDHPQKIRSDKAANMLAWLLQQNNTYYEHCVKQAFSMDTGYSADVICGIFDGLSNQNPLQFWDQISPFINIEIILQNCHHVSRLAVLYRIADRATQTGSANSSSVTGLMTSQFLSNSLVEPNTNISKPIWMHCLEKEWESLNSLGVLTNELIKHFKEEMKKVCSPLEIETTYDLEKMVSKGFKSKVEVSLNRWEAKVRFALNTALFKYTSQQTFLAIEDILRIYNPSSLITTQTVNHSSLADTLIETLAQGADPKIITGDRESFFLNYQEMAINQNTGKFLRIEITVVLISEFSGYKPNLPTDASLFSSRQLPNIDNRLQGYETCHTVDPDIAFLDTFTPAVPTDSFKRLINASDNDFLRTNWKNGKYERLGSPMSEGCLLAVKREAVHLTSGWGLAWVFRINERTVNIISKRW